MIIGRSVEGRAIEMHVCGSGKKCVLLFGAIHGDETDAAILCERFAQTFFATTAHGDETFLGARVLVVPIANPDGVAHARKDNANGVDLNRNFPARNWRAEHPVGYFPGVAPLSEPESRALAELIDREKPALIISVHQPFACVNWDGPARGIAREMSARCGLEAKASVGYPTPGSFGSLYGLDRELPVITLELSRPTSESELSRALVAITWAVEHGVADGR